MEGRGVGQRKKSIWCGSRSSAPGHVNSEIQCQHKHEGLGMELRVKALGSIPVPVPLHSRARQRPAADVGVRTEEDR